ncbi:hypothetical protein MBLNU230_g3463t1 [Neophaeotheca triangularis]
MDWPASWSGPRQPGQDIVSVKNLQLPENVWAMDAWGKTKEQPGLISVTLTLVGSFASAGSKDALDDSTIHYGKLAKAIRAANEQGQFYDRVINDCGLEPAQKMGERASGKTVIAHQRVELVLPKAAMFGLCGLVFCSSPAGDNAGLYLRDVNTMCLVGVNEYERAGRQPLVANFCLDGALPSAFLFQIERLMIELITSTAFETLESLVDYVIDGLNGRLLTRNCPGATVQLRLEKPRAIAFAEAPGVEVIRTVPDSKGKEKATG